MKDHAPASINRGLTSSLKGEYTTKAGKKATPGQMFKTLVHVVGKEAHTDIDKLDYRWIFTQGDPVTIRADLLTMMKKDTDNMQKIFNLSGNKKIASEFKELIDPEAKHDFLDDTFTELLDEMITGASFTK